MIADRGCSQWLPDNSVKLEHAVRVWRSGKYMKANARAASAACLVAIPPRTPSYNYWPIYFLIQSVPSIVAGGLEPGWSGQRYMHTGESGNPFR